MDIRASTSVIVETTPLSTPEDRNYTQKYCVRAFSHLVSLTLALIQDKIYLKSVHMNKSTQALRLSGAFNRDTIHLQAFSCCLLRKSCKKLQILIAYVIYRFCWQQIFKM